MAHDIFISYAAEDTPIADACCAHLEQAGIRCWIAPRDIISGNIWSASIVDAISGAKVLVLVFTEHSNISAQVEREVERAASRGLAILPFRVRDARLSKHMEYFISTLHWLDALSPPLERHLEKLVQMVRLVLAQATGAAPEFVPQPRPQVAQDPSQRPAAVAPAGRAARRFVVIA